MYSAWFGSTNSAPGNAAVAFHAPNGAWSPGWNATEANRSQVISENITITRFSFYSATAVATGTYTFAIMDNGVATSVSVALTASATTATFTGAVAISQDHLISLRSTPTSTPTALTNTYWVIEYTTSGNFFLMMGGMSTGYATGANNFIHPMGFSGSLQGTTAPLRMGICPAAGTLTRLSVATPNGVVGGTNYAMSARINDTTDVLTATIGAAASAAQATGSTAVAAGDTLTIKGVPTGTPTARSNRSCVTIQPTNPGETWVMEGGDGNGSGMLSDNTTRFEQLSGIGFNGLDPTETNRLMGLLAGYKLRHLYWGVGTAPGGVATRTLSIRDNASTTLLAATITGAATTANDIIDEIVLSGLPNSMSLQFSAAGTPALSPSYRAGYILDIPQILGPPPYNPIMPFLPNLVR